MLSARYIASLSDNLVELYAQLEADIKTDIFKRLNKLKKITDETVYQTELLKETGALKNDVQKYVAKYDVKARKELESLFNDAMDMATEKDLKYYQLGKRELSAEQSQMMNASIDRFGEREHPINKTYAKQQQKFEELYNSLVRMTLTVADATEKSFLRECNSAYMKVASGAYSWQDAYKQSIINLATDGVRTVIYTGSGKPRTYTIESATRMNILTGINQTASEQTLENADNLGTNLVEVSAHIGARPEHEQWQGKVYCLDGEADYKDADGVTRHAPNFYKVCRFGEADGICGINCRHSFYPYFEGTPLEYSKGELDEMKDKTVKLDGKNVTPYEAEQELRLAERNIRYYKSIANGFELTNNTDGNADYIKARQGIARWQERARVITNDTGIQRKYINEMIGTKGGTLQPKGLSGGMKSDKQKEILNKQEKVSPKQLQRVLQSAKRQGVHIEMGKDMDRFLEMRGAEAITFDDGTIVYHSKVSASGMFEEIIHRAQIKRYGNATSRKEICEREIEAKEKLLRYAKSYGITEFEVELQKKEIERYKQELAKLIDS